MDSNAEVGKLFSLSCPITEQNRDNDDNTEVNVTWNRRRLINMV